MQWVKGSGSCHRPRHTARCSTQILQVAKGEQGACDKCGCCKPPSADPARHAHPPPPSPSACQRCNLYGG